jgi:hypothetical protein
LRAWNSLRRTSRNLSVLLTVLGALLSAMAAPAIHGSDTDQGLLIKVAPRTPAQIAAFYEARGFPQTALAKLSAYCFIGVSVRNNTGTVVWLQPGRWRFHAKNTKNAIVAPISSNHWRQLWREIGLPGGKQATFRWTQLPDERDLRPQEPVGGNIAMQTTAGIYDLEMVFSTGTHGDGPEIRRRFAGLRCPPAS